MKKHTYIRTKWLTITGTVYATETDQHGSVYSVAMDLGGGHYLTSGLSDVPLVHDFDLMIARPLDTTIEYKVLDVVEGVPKWRQASVSSATNLLPALLQEPYTSLDTGIITQQFSLVWSSFGDVAGDLGCIHADTYDNIKKRANALLDSLYRKQAVRYDRKLASIGVGYI